MTNQSRDKSIEYEKFSTAYESQVFRALESMHSESFSKGYYIAEIIKGKEKWIIRWEKDLTQK